MKLAQRTTSWLGGVNTLLNQEEIPPDAVRALDNGIIDLAGFVRQRYGNQYLGGPEAASSLPPQGLAHITVPGGPAGLFGFWGGGAYWSSGGDVWQAQATAASLVDALHSAVLGRRSDGAWIACIHSVMQASAVSVPYSHLLFINPISTEWTQRGDLAAGCALFWQGRLWIGDVPSYAPDTIMWSHIWDAADFSAAVAGGNSIRVDPQQGGRITALVAARGNEPQIYIFKEQAIYLFRTIWSTDGAIPVSSDALDPAQASIEPLSYRVGCIAPLSAHWIPTSEGGDAYFLAYDGVRSLRRTQEDVPRGGAGQALTVGIQNIIDRITWAHARNSVGAVFNNQYFLAVPLDGAIYPTHVLVKNLLAQPYAGWSVWTLRARALTSSMEAQPKFYFQAAVPAPEGDSAISGTYIYRIHDAAPNIDPGTQPISFVLETRAYDMGERLRGVRKYWRWVELHYDTDESGATVTPAAAIDQQDSWYTLPPFFASYDVSNIVLPSPLPWVFGEGRIQTHKIGLDDVQAGYSLRLRFMTEGPGIFRLRKLEIVAQPYGKEWV